MTWGMSQLPLGVGSIFSYMQETPGESEAELKKMGNKPVGPWASPSQQTLSYYSHKSLDSFKPFKSHSGCPTYPLPIFGEEDLGSLHIKGHWLNATANPVPGVAL